ncbi:hypothetical protein BMF29_14885 [Comamonas kerstersii]|nr:hypothetical protein BMF38_04385 [Comamonas kerstersii]OOH89704.1 hypothetical protein BMF29_14885 [Comamonas kerstersii]
MLFLPLPLVGEGWGEGLQHTRKHIAGLLQYLVVPETQDDKTLRLQPRCTNLVMAHLFSFVVLATIELYHEVALKAYKIQHINPKRVLTAKLATT